MTHNDRGGAGDGGDRRDPEGRHDPGEATPAVDGPPVSDPLGAATPEGRQAGGARRAGRALPGTGRAGRRGSRGSRAEAPRSRLSSWAEVPVILAMALVLSVVIKTFFAQAFFIPSGSMENTLLRNDRVIVNKLADSADDLERGDIVVFRDPGGWLDAQPAVVEAGGLQGALRDVLVFIGLAPSASEEDLIKRVVGTGGDRVVCCDVEGRLTVNGVPLEEEYVFPGDAASAETFDVEVPEGSLWLLGDHRASSRDARRHQDDERGGMVPVSAVVGRAFVRVWPLGRFDTFGTPATFDQPALDAAGASSAP